MREKLRLEGLWQMTPRLEGMDDTSNPYPVRPGEPDCLHFMRTGDCRFGTGCRFNHPARDKLVATSAANKDDFPERIGQPECQYFLRTGTCKFGATCKFHHPPEYDGLAGVHVQHNLLGLPLRPGEKECSYYLRTGTCKYGFACKFHHPQLATVGTMLPVPGSLVYTAAGNVGTPVPGQYQARFPSWPMARHQYMPGPCIQGISSYMPVIVSPAHMPNWITYQGQISSKSPSDGLQQTRSFYGATQQHSDPLAGSKYAAMASLGWTGAPALQLQMGRAEISFPERPGQPECHYYMKTGDCKFGASCKFHHPKDGSTSSSSCALSIIGLPLRPGQPPCTFYIRYGICKFGPTCKFDHPVVGLAYNSSVTSMLDIAMAPTPSGSSPNTVLAPEVSHETPKPQNSIVRSEAPSTYASADGECEDVNL
eukprot:c28224_g3_i1 orf=657-1928(-)